MQTHSFSPFVSWRHSIIRFTSFQKTSEWATELEIKEDAVVALTTAVDKLIHECLFRSEIPTQVLGPDFHAQLGGLLNKILRAHAAEWRQSALNNQISPPKLLGFDWRVGTKVSSDSISRMNETTLQLSLEIQDNPREVGVMPPQTTVQLELSKQELATMLDGLVKIRDQLGSIK